MGDWTLFSNYGHVLVCLANDNEARLRDVALEVGITERAAQKIVKDLQDAGYLFVTRHGRRNRYRINRRKPLRHALESHCNVGKLLALLSPTSASVETERPDAEPAILPRPAPQAGTPIPEEVKTRYPSVAEQSPKDDGEKGKRKKPAAADTREQGSLF